MDPFFKSKAKKLIGPEKIRPTCERFRVRGIFNPAGVMLPDGKILLYARVSETPHHDDKIFVAPHFSGKSNMELTMDIIPREDILFEDNIFKIRPGISRLPTISHLRKIIIAKNGVDVEKVSDRPDFYGLKDDGDFGVEDPRITFLDEENRYLMTYVSVSLDSGISTSLAVSKDLEEWKRQGIIFRHQNKDAVIFPEKINGYYVALNRPEGNMVFDKPAIWISYSKDLKFWGRDKPIVLPRDEGWDDIKIGAGAVPIKTDEGWLEIYHGVTLERKDDPASQKIYSAGAILFKNDDPEEVIARSPKNDSLFSPEEKFEKEGFVNDVVFPTVALPDKQGKNVFIYSGCGDACISVRKILLKEILNSLE